MTDLVAAHQHLSDYFTATAQTSGTFSCNMAVTPEAVKPTLRLVHHLLQPGRHLVLLGDAGCGKATLVHAAGRLAGCACTRPQDFGLDLRANFRQQLKASPLAVALVALGAVQAWVCAGVWSAERSLGRTEPA